MSREVYSVHEIGDDKPIVYPSLAVAIAVSVSMSTMNGWRYQVRDYYGEVYWDTDNKPVGVGLEELY